MKKGSSSKNKSFAIFSFVALSAGAVMLITAPFIPKSVATYLGADCVMDEYGQCPFQTNFPNSIHSLQAGVVWGVVGLVLIGIGLGLYLYLRHK
jgi:hypothetical protein